MVRQRAKEQVFNRLPIWGQAKGWLGAHEGQASADEKVG